jgi:hypothetical protein
VSATLAATLLCLPLLTVCGVCAWGDAPAAPVGFEAETAHTEANCIFNPWLQVHYAKQSPALILRVTAFRIQLLGPASVRLDGQEYTHETLAAMQPPRLTGSVTYGTEYVRVAVDSSDGADFIYRLPIAADTYTGAPFLVGGTRGRLDAGPEQVLARVTDPGLLVLGALSQRRLALAIGAAGEVVVRRDADGGFWLELSAVEGRLAFTIRPPALP